MKSNLMNFKLQIFHFYNIPKKISGSYLNLPMELSINILYWKAIFHEADHSPGRFSHSVCPSVRPKIKRQSLPAGTVGWPSGSLMTPVLLFLFPGAKVEYNDALVLFSEKKISNIQSIIPALEIANQVKIQNMYKSSQLT